MKVNNTMVFMGDDTNRLRHSEQPLKTTDTGRKSINGASFRAKTDPIAAKREEARKRAMKIVGDAFTNELKIDDDLNTRRDKVKALQQEKGEAKRAIKEIEDGREALRDMYGVDPDSKEEQDLKLLEKEVRSKMPGSEIILSKEEKEQIAKIRENGLSEYQERSLDMLESETYYHQTVYEADIEIKTENQIISATELERLKSHAVIDAEKQADAIMDAASDEIVSMLVDEAKTHIDDEAEEKKEQAKAEKEKQEEVQEKIDAAKARRKESEELTEDILDGVQEASHMTSDVNQAQQEIKDMMNKMKLIEDDIKGAAVDKSV